MEIKHYFSYSCICYGYLLRDYGVHNVICGKDRIKIEVSILPLS